MRTFVVGDIHGQVVAFSQVLRDAGFNLEQDRLIVLGDIVDGGPDTFEVVEILLTVKNLVMILGNHDAWFIRHINGGMAFDKDSYSDFQLWYQQGGKATLDSYQKHGYDYGSIPISHQTIFNRMQPYFIDEKNRLYVHGGIDLREPIEQQTVESMTWDRHMIAQSRANVPSPYRNIFFGHTDIRARDPVTNKPINNEPVQYPNGAIGLDTGAGWDGVLTIMNVDTLKYWQSDKVKNGR